MRNRKQIANTNLLLKHLHTLKHRKSKYGHDGFSMCTFFGKMREQSYSDISAPSVEELLQFSLAVSDGRRAFPPHIYADVLGHACFLFPGNLELTKVNNKWWAPIPHTQTWEKTNDVTRGFRINWSIDYCANMFGFDVKKFSHLVMGRGYIKNHDEIYDDIDKPWIGNEHITLDMVIRNLNAMQSS